MHTYEYICDICKRNIHMEIHKKVDYEVKCLCGNAMTLIFYLLSPDTRTGGNNES